MAISLDLFSFQWEFTPIFVNHCNSIQILDVTIVYYESNKHKKMFPPLSTENCSNFFMFLWTNCIPFQWLRMYYSIQWAEWVFNTNTDIYKIYFFFLFRRRHYKCWIKAKLRISYRMIKKNFFLSMRFF